MLAISLALLTGTSPVFSSPGDFAIDDLRFSTQEGGLALLADARVPAGHGGTARAELRLRFDPGAVEQVHDIARHRVAWNLVDDASTIEGVEEDALSLVSVDPFAGVAEVTLALPLPERTRSHTLELRILAPTHEAPRDSSPPLAGSSGEDGDWFEKCQKVQVLNNCNDDPTKEICMKCVKAPAPIDTCAGEGGTTGPGYIFSPAQCLLGWNSCGYNYTTKSAATYLYASKVQKECSTISGSFGFDVFLPGIGLFSGAGRREKKTWSTCCTYVCDENAPLKTVNVRDC